jgi:hypothetical protein
MGRWMGSGMGHTMDGGDGEQEQEHTAQHNYMDLSGS